MLSKLIKYTLAVISILFGVMLLLGNMLNYWNKHAIIILYQGPDRAFI